MPSPGRGSFCKNLPRSWRGSHSTSAVPSPPASWELNSSSTFWESGAHLPTPYKGTFFLNHDALPLSQGQTLNLGIRLDQRCSSLGDVESGTEDSNSLEQRERDNLKRELLAGDGFCPWSGEQRQPVSKEEENGHLERKQRPGQRVSPDVPGVLRNLVAGDSRGPAASLPLGSGRESPSSYRIPLFSLRAAVLGLYQLPLEVLTSMFFFRSLGFSGPPFSL